MNKIEFIHSLESQPVPPSSLSDELQALWWAKKGDWERAHDLAQDAKQQTWRLGTCLPTPGGG